MKHFFEQTTILDDNTLSELLRTARQELKKKPMNLSEMSSKMDLICFNASASEHYIPRGLDSLITTKHMPLNQKIGKDFDKDLEKLIGNTQGDVFGYLLGNIQTKEIFNYLDILFQLKHDFRFKPQVVSHFSYGELVAYLSDFLNAGVVDGTKRAIEVFDDRNPSPWKKLVRSSELSGIDKSVREPIILDRPFFTDISLNITKGGRPQTVDCAIGKLKSVLGYFNKYRTPSGEVIASRNKMFIQPKDIKGFKLASTQSNILLGVSYKGEYISSAQFISHDIGIKSISMTDIDFFTFKINKKPTDIRPDQITRIEFNLDTQQTIFSRGIGSDEFHVARFNKLKLKKADESVFIHKVIPFNRGESNFDQLQTFFASRYTEFEKAQQILTARGELGLLGARNVCTGDLTSFIALSTMKLLGLIPFEPKSLGFGPANIKHPEAIKAQYQSDLEQLKEQLKEILDVSQSPDFTEHNFSRLSKNMRAFIKLNDLTAVEPDTFKKLIQELEDLLEYMDNFFKLSMYKDLKDNLECEVAPDLEEIEQELELAPDESKSRLDEKTRQFISENFSFFKKRNLIQKAALKIEKVLFYSDHVKPFAENPAFNPAIVVYNNETSQADNYKHASYPAFSLSKVLNPAILQNDDEIDELQFVKFMRDFTNKTFQKARELNQTFHHQYKHTLSELGFVVDEKLRQLKEELAFLEKPENKEKAYRQLFEKIRKMYLDHLKSKEKNIENLKVEESQVQKKLQTYKQHLEKLLGSAVDNEKLDEELNTMPDRMEKMKVDIIKKHKAKMGETSPVFTSYIKLFKSALNYFNKVLGYSSLFQKALSTHRYQKMLEEEKEKIKAFYHAEPSQIAKKIQEVESSNPDPEDETALKKEIDQLSAQLKEALEDMEAIPTGELMKSPKTPEDKLLEYIEYYRDESYRLTRLVGMLQKSYQEMNTIQNQLFKKQEQLAQEQLKSARIQFQLKLLQILKRNPEATEEVEAVEEKTESIPTEIKNELGSLRAKLIEALNDFKSNISQEKLASIADYRKLMKEAKVREKINDIAKELVNFNQGIKAIRQEREGEIKDLEYLKSQEASLEKVAMSKALPSTRILLKTQYIPMVEKEKAMMDRVNRFLAEIISNEEQIIDGMTSTFFRKRYGFRQFIKGSYCVDTTKGTKDHTEKNVYAAYIRLSERYPKACAAAQGTIEKIALNKVEVLGMEGLRNRISQIWHKHLDDRFLCLPPSLEMREVLDLCDYKDTIAKNSQKSQRSENSLILIYIHKIDWEAIKSNPSLLESYNQAILSNVFIDVDDIKVFNNRDSILEGFVKGTFGQAHDAISDQITQVFLHS